MQTDTIKLLRECNAGIKMGESAIKKVLPHTKNENLKNALIECKNTHATLGDETHAALLSHGADTKEPHAIIRAMSDVKIYAKMMAKSTDAQIADVMTDGCDMGIKSLTHYLNKYKNASKDAKAITKRLIESEEKLEHGIREYL